jgi:hypothetical protein
MSIYSEQLQQLTDQLVAQVGDLYNLSTATPIDMQAMNTQTSTVETTAQEFDQAIKTTDIPPENTQILSLSTQMQMEIDDLQAAITANDEPLVVTRTNAVVLTTSNINRCVTAMAQYAPAEIPPPSLPPWFEIPTTPIS